MQFPLFPTEQGHQQHHNDNVLHIPPLVHVEQDAKDDDLYELSGEKERGRECLRDTNG